MPKTVFLNYQYNAPCHEFTISGDYIQEDVIRSEGRVAMSLKNPKLIIECEDFGAHNHHKALIFLSTFYPVFPLNQDCVFEFNFPVSSDFVTYFTSFPGLKKAQIKNIAPALPYTSTGAVISYGGGLDSTAISLLLPNITKIHQVSMTHSAPSAMEAINVRSNIRELFTVGGLPVWTSVFVVSMIRNVKYILAGSLYTSSYLTNGSGYKEIFNNAWYTIYQRCNISLLPGAYISEITSAELVAKYVPLQNIELCGRKQCTQCTKCLRKFLELALFNEEYLHKIEQFDVENNVKIQALFNADTLYFSHCFKYCVNELLAKHPNMHNLRLLKQYIARYQISDVSYLPKYYLQDFGNTNYGALAAQIIEALHINNIQPMSERDVQSFKQFSCKKL